MSGRRGVKRSRSGARRVLSPAGCPLTCPVDLWKYLVEQGVWSPEQQEREGPAPWEIRPYQGPAEVLIGTEQYVHMQQQFQRNEKRRIQQRLREIERYLRGKPWVGPVPTAAEVRWSTFVELQREERRRKRKEIRVVVRTVKVEPSEESATVLPDLVWQDPYQAHTQRVAEEDVAMLTPSV